MKAFILFLILGLCKELVAKTKCEERFDQEREHYCAIAPDCYQDLPTEGKIEYYKCRRKEEGLEDFKEIREGYCPDDIRKPPCPILLTVE